MMKQIVTVVCALLVMSTVFSCHKKEVEAEPLPPEEVQLNTAVSLFTAIPHPVEYVEEIAAILNHIEEEKTLFITDILKVIESDTDNLLLLIDKRNTVGEDFIPADLVTLVKNNSYPISKNNLSLREPVEKALTVMAEGAKKDGISLLVSSTYRSYDYQTMLFNNYVARDGLEEAERYSARPGTSQHQLGVAIDFGNIDESYAETKPGKWLAAHAEEYGFSLSFPQGYEPITGYMWECWHFRYIGDQAVAFQNNWFNDIQQYMIEFVDCWRKAGAEMSSGTASL